MSISTSNHKKKTLKKLNFAIFICSTSRYNQNKDKIEDISGNIISKMVKNAGHKVAIKKIIADDKNMIIKALKEVFKLSDLHAAIFSGGTGINPTDITIVTVIPFLEIILPGFVVVFRQISFKEIGSAAFLSRAIAGIANEKVIYCIPGSPNAVRLSVERLILPETAHIVKHIRE